MAILTRPRLLPQERFDLEDLNTLLAALRSDSKLYTKQFISNANYVLKGFSVSGIGLKSATVTMADATLIIPQNTSDFSWYVASPTEANITIPDSDLTDNTRNYVEIQLFNENNTPLTRAFWDPEANSGLGSEFKGSEFNQIVETVTDLAVKMTVSTGGFTGSPDRLPLCIIDVDSSGNIKTILDRRNLLLRLAKPSDLDNGFSWTSREEPAYALTLTSASGTFQDGETITIGTETATVKTGGTTSISFIEPTGINFFPGGSVTGQTSGATGTISTVYEAFSGADKSVKSFKDMFDALMTEIKLIKGTRFWYEDSETSIAGLASTINSLFVQAVIGAKFSWDGTYFKISDNSVAPDDSDVLAYLRVMGRSGDISLTRQDGQGGSTSISVGNKQVVYVKIPSSGSKTFSGVGTTTTNFQVSNISDFVANDENYWIAYRELGRLYIRGYGELDVNEEVIINDPMKEDLQNQIDAINAVLDAPAYEETIEVVSSSPTGNQLAGPISSGTVITLPNNSRLGNNPQFYTVGKGGLEVYLNGQLLIEGYSDGWNKVGTFGTDSDEIEIQQALEVGDILSFRIDSSGGPGSGGSGGGGAPDDNFITLAQSTVADDADYVLIYDTSVGGYRKQTRSDLLQGLNGAVPINEYNTDVNLTALNGFVKMDTTSTTLTVTLPSPAAVPNKKFDIKNIGTGTMVIDGDGALIDNMSTVVSSVQFESYTVISDGTQYWLI